MPIVGQFGSLAGLGSFLLPGGAFESIATVTVGSGGASEFVFDNIPGGFQHLQIRMINRGTTDNSGGDQPVFLRFNGDTGSNYARHYLLGNGSAASAGASTSQTSSEAHGLNTIVGTQIYAAAIIDVLDYASTSKNKTIRTFVGWDGNGSGSAAIVSGLWMSTSAVTAIRLFVTAANFKQYSTAALYGVRA